METENKHIKIVETPHKGKTKKFDVISKSSEYILGYIDWYNPWRQYCFTVYPDGETVFNSTCLELITNFLKDINVEHKKNLPPRKRGGCKHC